MNLEPRLQKVLTNHNKKVQGTSDDQQIKLAKVDIDNLGELSSKYNVQAVPTGKSLSFLSVKRFIQSECKK